ncbi:MAG: sulfur carrier protein ThiS [Bacteroidales bacterium]|nr:sulfur carrier protein ThiS [Bacteroidales bacterium]
MKITLNNREESFDNDTITVADLLKEKNFTFKMLVIKINGKLIKKEFYSSTLINENDNVLVLHLISGG